MKRRNPNKAVLLLKKLGAKILFSSPVGKALAILYRNRIPCYDFVVDTGSRFFLAKSKAAVFFRAYEGAELRFVRKYLQTECDVVELGSSFGIVSSQIGSKLKSTNRRLFCVEPNPHLIHPLKTNLAINGNLDNCYVLNKMIHYGNSEHANAVFQISDNILVSKKTGFDQAHEGYVQVEKATLSELINEYGIGAYSLVMDIEGAEIEIMLNDGEAFSKCQRIIAELHDTNYKGISYSVDDMIALMQTKLSFRMIDSYGPVIVLERNGK